MIFPGKPKKSGDNINEINMTPLIDVSLVLVVMLLLATPLAFESSIAIKKAMDSAKERGDALLRRFETANR